MGKLILLAVALSGCGLYFGGEDKTASPDAAVKPADAAAECEEGLPSCASLSCAVGAITPDCPRVEDKSVCYCPAPVNPGWCVQH